MGRDPAGLLLERDAELAELEALSIAATTGDGCVVLVEGAAGIGKSRLLAGARTAAEGAGMRVLTARGGELEREFSFGAVRQLLEPALAAASPDEREALLRGAAGLAERAIFGFDAVGGGGELFPVLHGLYWLVANLATEQPLALVIDDLHWCDGPSVAFVDFLSRRLDGLAVLVATACRPNEPGAEQGLIDAVASGAATRVIRPRPLSEDATTRLIHRSLSPDADPAFCAACHEASGGNPLLLAELAQALVAEGVAPTAEHAARVRDIGPEPVARAVRLRLAPLPPEAAALAEAASVLGDGALLADAARLAGLDRETALDAAGALERVQLVRAGERIEFGHPMLRAAVYAGLGPAGRRAAHLRAARMLSDAGRPPEQIAAHILAGPPNADERAVAVLRDAARRAIAGGDAQAASTYLARALREPPADAERADVLLELGRAEALLHGPDAATHMREALALTRDPARRPAIALALGRTLYFASAIPEAAEVFTAALAEPGVEPALIRSLETSLVVLGLFDPALVPVARERLAGFDPEAPAVAIDELILLVYGAYDDVRTIRTTPAEAAERALRADAGGRLLAEDSQGGWAAAEGVLVACDRLAEAERIARDVLEAGRAAGSIFLVVSGHAMLAFVLRHTGALQDAVAEGFAALETAQSHGFTTVLHWGAAHLANALADRGDTGAASDLLDELGFGGELPDSVHLYELLLARARVRIAAGRVREGADDALEVGRRFEAIGGTNPSVLPWRSTAAAGLVALGETEQARRLAAAEADHARAWGTPRALAQALRMLGLATGGDEGIALLREAADVTVGSPALLERAYALAELGAGLRRANRRAEGRQVLQDALDAAHRCGARRLEERVLRELRATGARPRRLAASGRDALTPSELRVAEMAAQGLTNREIAQRLFVTQKTVEAHMSRSLRKLGVGSRSQIAGALRDG